MGKHLAVVATAVLLTVNACDSGSNDSVDTVREPPRSASTGSPSPTATDNGALSATIPDGNYSRVARREDAIAAGFDAALVDELLGPDGELPLVIKLAGDRFTIFVTSDAGITEPGDLGTFTYDQDGHWVTVSESEGCPSCVQTFDWSLADGSLTLKLVPMAGQRAYEDGERLVTEGTYEHDS